METIGYALVGAGYFGAELGRIVNDLEGAKITSIYDPYNAEEIAKELNCDIESSLDVLLQREDVNAVIIASPNYLHKEQVLKVAHYGKHVFCEKPIALSYEDCNDMVNACKKAGVIFMAGHIMNFFNGVRTAKKLINEGKIGKILYCHSARNGWEDTKGTISWKKIREKSGGHLYHHIHELDCIQFIMGTPKTATMVGGNVAHKGEQFGNEDDMLFISLEFENNSFAILEYGSAFRWSEHYLLIQGTEGAIKIDIQNTGMVLKNKDGITNYLVHETKEEDEDRAKIYKGAEDGAIIYGKPGNKTPMWLYTLMKKEMKFFKEIITGAKVDEEFSPLLTGKAARDSIATADACTVSLKENRKVNISEIIKTS